MIANFQCHKCQLKFQDEPGMHVTCFRCGHPYMTWVDWPKFKKLAEAKKRSEG